MKQTKGLSTIVTTLILVLLGLVAVGILWNPIKNLLGENTEAFDKTKCLTVDIKPSVSATTGTNYDVTLSRKDGGEETVEVKLVFRNDTASSTVLDFGETLDALETKSTLGIEGEIEGATIVEITPYFRSAETNKEQLCSTFDAEVTA